MAHRGEEPRTRSQRHSLVGRIWSAGFASGDRFVVGVWDESPVGPMTDVMWARPGGERVLLAPDERTAVFVRAVYTFDRTDLVHFAVDDRRTELRLRAGEIELSLRAGPGWRIPVRRLRPPWVTRYVEAPIARRLLGVRTFGISPTGVREWYRADEYRPLVSGVASVAGQGLGTIGDVDPPAGFGFSEPPRRPSVVSVRPLLEGVPIR